MPIQISMDRNIINVLNEKLLKNKLLPALSHSKIIIHLTDIFIQELLIDEAVTRRTRHSNILCQLFNGKIVLSMKEVLKAELSGKKDLFFDQTIETGIKQLLDAMAQGKQLSPFQEAKRQELLKSKKSYDEDLRIGQEMNLKGVFNGIKKAIISGLLCREKLERFDFEQYYGACLKDQKLRKLQNFLEVNGITYDGDISLCLDSQEFPRINFWLRSLYAYHYYTMQRWQPTLRKNDATDLNYIGSGYCVDRFITNDKMLKTVGNICFNSADKFITWDNFESKFLPEIEDA